MDVAGVAPSTQDLADLGEVAQRPSVEAAVQAVLDVLGADVAYATAIDGDTQTVQVLRGDGSFLKLAGGSAVPFAETYCQRVLAGRLQSVIPDVQADDRARSVGGGAGAFAAVPIVFADGTIHGTLCAATREARPTLGYRDLQVLRVLARITADSLERTALVDRALEAERRGAMVDALVAAVEARDGATPATAAAVADHAVAVARRLDLDEDEVADVARLAVLHDLGKLAVPESVLGRAGTLSTVERARLEAHSAEGERVVGQAPALAHLAPSIRAGHERWDGTGYPDGLRGAAIPLAARIVLVCDAYHAMITDRPYRLALTPADAVRELEAGLGTQFCPIAGRAFLNVLAGRA